MNIEDTDMESIANENDDNIELREEIHKKNVSFVWKTVQKVTRFVLTL